MSCAFFTHPRADVVASFLQLCRTWQKAVVGYLGPTGSALPQLPAVKGAVAFDFEPSSFSRTIANLHAAKHGGISFTSYRCAKHAACPSTTVCMQSPFT